MGDAQVRRAGAQFIQGKCSGGNRQDLSADISRGLNVGRRVPNKATSGFRSQLGARILERISKNLRPALVMIAEKPKREELPQASGFNFAPPDTLEISRSHAEQRSPFL